MKEADKPGPSAGGTRDVASMLRIALLLGILLHLLGFFFFRVESNPLPSREDDSAFIALMTQESGQEFSEFMDQASLFDSAPLFIPGQWTASSKVLYAPLHEELVIFPEHGPELELIEEMKPRPLSWSQLELVKQPLDLLDLRFWDLWKHFGEGGEPVVPFEAVGPELVVTVLAGGADGVPDRQYRLSFDLQTDDFGERPAIYYYAMSGPGIPIRGPVMSQTSGSDALDTAVLEWLKRPETQAVLPGGYLEIRAYP